MLQKGDYVMKKIIGTNIRTLRILYNLTQKSVANELNVPPPTYINWEKGLREPNIFNLKKISLYYSVSLDDLLTTDPLFSKPLIDDKVQRLEQALSLSEETIKNIFKDNLKSLRVFKGKTRKEIAIDLSVAPSGYTNWEYGYRQPDFATLKKISSYHDIGVDTLVSHKITEYDLLEQTGESKEELISRFSKDLYERYLKIPDEYKSDVQKKLFQHVNSFNKKVKNIIK
ncbi:transcriptional regulator [Bacillus cereus]|uniref:Transcriptional regulator n=2 Tax=Bacillus cereus TaxID=1396 RepID=A0A9X6WXM0_BACCE|nr:transcriptional regulator [Bacillus cereus]